MSLSHFCSDQNIWRRPENSWCVRRVTCSRFLFVADAICCRFILILFTAHLQNYISSTASASGQIQRLLLQEMSFCIWRARRRKSWQIARCSLTLQHFLCEGGMSHLRDEAETAVRSCEWCIQILVFMFMSVLVRVGWMGGMMVQWWASSRHTHKGLNPP